MHPWAARLNAQFFSDTNSTPLSISGWSLVVVGVMAPKGWQQCMVGSKVEVATSVVVALVVATRWWGGSNDAGSRVQSYYSNIIDLSISPSAITS
ncbi:hypothetical protein L6452_33935 [Arctium lappa]|uniref:Uncharacterized protein n=1 Tax=Arctium lappa TaxID=4217 RepID=A0ACB8YGU5_ARCLA|nr:hypothetical protein L6452_33935 [Arctium lappa]